MTGSCSRRDPVASLAGWWQKRLAFGIIIYEPDGRYQFCERDGVTRHIAESPRIRFARGIGQQAA